MNRRMTAAGVVARLAALAVQHHRGHPGRLITSVLGIALGVGLALAVHLINRAAVNEFTLAVQNVAGEADLQATAPAGGFADALFAELARMPDVAVASPVLEVDAAVSGRDEAMHVLGVDPFRALVIQPGLLGEDGGRAFEVLEPDTVLLSAAAATWLDVTEGDSIALVVGMRPVELRVAAVLPEGSLRGRVALMDIGTAQWRLDMLGMLNRIDLRLRPGVDVEKARIAIARAASRRARTSPRRRPAPRPVRTFRARIA